MAKYFHRLGTDKKDFLVTVKLNSLRADITEKTFFSVVWKRGAHADDSAVIEMEPGKPLILDQTFTKSS